jgi:hypothetical protein
LPCITAVIAVTRGISNIRTFVYSNLCIFARRLNLQNFLR